MNYAENPITDLADCIAHAQYEGFSDIHYEDRDRHYVTVRSCWANNLVRVAKLAERVDYKE